MERDYADYRRLDAYQPSRDTDDYCRDCGRQRLPGECWRRHQCRSCALDEERR